MTSKLTEKLRQERCSALIEMLQQFAMYVNGSKRLPDGSTLQEMLGDYHLQALVRDIEAHYKVRLDDVMQGKAVVDHDHLKALLVADKPRFHTYNLRQYVVVEFASTLENLLKEAAESQDVREIDRHQVSYVWGMISSDCANHALRLPRSK